MDLDVISGLDSERLEVAASPIALNEVDKANSYNLLHTLVAGGIAGIVVDIALFPIDTVKTRLQSQRGFWRSGGFRGIYKGLAPAAAGSAPTAALFFSAYEGSKCYLNTLCGSCSSPYIHMASASIGEVFACLLRVPVEIAKQRRQALSHKEMSALQILWSAYKTEGIQRGLYRGFSSTISREIPFSFLQFPLWEFFKLKWTPLTGYESSPLTVALCGAVAGGISAGLTTPLDVAKTRIMLADNRGASHKLGVSETLRSVYREGGYRGLFAGLIPRVIWITLGGAFFFGFYDLSTRLLESHTISDSNNAKM